MTDFNDKLKTFNKKITSNKTIHVEAGKKIADLTYKVAQLLEKGYDFLLGRMFFTGNGGYQNFSVFAPMLNSIKLDSNKKVTNWILRGISSEKNKPFDTNLEPTMSNLLNGRVTLIFSNSILAQKIFSSLYSKFILNLYIVYELNTGPRNPTNNFLW